MQVKGILFDLDGTLVNTTELIIKSFEYTLKNNLDIEPSRYEITQYFGLPLRESLEKFIPTGVSQDVDELVEYYRDYNGKYHDELIKPYPFIEETLQSLQQQDIKIAVVTSKKQPMAKRGLKCFNLDQYVEGIIGHDECIEHKPSAEPMLRGAEILKLRPEECLCVGDSPFDLQSGHGAGCRSVAVAWTTVEWQKMLREGQPNFIINKMSDLLTIVAKLNQESR